MGKASGRRRRGKENHVADPSHPSTTLAALKKEEKISTTLASLGKWVRLRDESAKQLITLSEDWGRACSNGDPAAAEALLPDLKDMVLLTRAMTLELVSLCRVYEGHGNIAYRHLHCLNALVLPDWSMCASQRPCAKPDAAYAWASLK